MELITAAQETNFPWVQILIMAACGAISAPIGGWISRNEGSSVTMGAIVMAFCGFLLSAAFVVPITIINDPANNSDELREESLISEVRDVYGLEISAAGAETLLEGVNGDEEERVGEVLRFGSIEVVTSATESVEVQLAWRDSTWLLLDEDGEPMEPLTPVEGWN